MKPPLKISVITVTYNAANLIARTIGSVEEQTYAAVEHIIIDGNSPVSYTHLTLPTILRV